MALPTGSDPGRNRRRLIRHALRSLVKAGDPAALAVLGYGADSPARVGEAKMLTRTHYPGQHNVDVLANRIAVAVGSFTPTA